MRKINVKLAKFLQRQRSISATRVEVTAFEPYTRKSSTTILRQLAAATTTVGDGGLEAQVYSIGALARIERSIKLRQHELVPAWLGLKELKFVEKVAARE